MRTAAIALALILLAATPLQAQQLQPPAAPVVTVSADIRELIFDWDPVPGAYTYWLLEKKDSHSSFTRIGERIPGGRPRAAVAVAVHLQNWPEARYAVAACNLAGCTNSSAINPQDLMLDTIGYFKASNAEAGDMFGGGLALSADGSTMVVGALLESSNATGVNGNQADNSSQYSGAVYVFRRDGRRWRQEAYLKAGVNQTNQRFGGVGAINDSIAVSGDGSWLAVGAAPDNVQGVTQAGTVYMFHRASDGSWTQQTALHAPQLIAYDGFGLSIDMTEDGQMLKVSSRGTSDETSPEHIFERTDSTWQLTTTVEPAYPGYNCGGSRMSGDGSTLLVYCGTELLVPGEQMLTLKRSGDAWNLVSNLPMADTFASQPMALNHDATRMAMLEGWPDRALVIHRWSGNQWVRETVVSVPGATTAESSFWNFGLKAKFSRNGRMVAVAAMVATVAGAGVTPSPAPGTEPHGAVFLYDRTSNSQTPWVLRSVVKAPNPGRNDYFGLPLALSANGRYLAVGASLEDGNARGIDGDRTSNSAEDAGAVYLY